ncbi:MAG TPA: AarF/ABC1/UbiB kinase family protein [Humisphaera sp.]|nr:AarF/ABC1/UbiB kinase family protein [Humisphaera sp.]
MPPPKDTGSRFRFAGDLARAADVARVLAKYGLAQWLSDSDFEPVRNALKSETGESLMAQPFEARVRLALTDLGATYIKLGQMLSTRADLVGQDLANELTKLQAQTPADAPAVARKVVETELGLPIEEIFSEFDETALASASIGQVHRARLKTGKRVVVKVQHPGIEGIIRRDLDILGFLAEMAEMNDTLKRYQPLSIVKEFGRTMLNELDFRRELRNLQAFRRNFAKDKTIVFPKPYPELASGRVFTMQSLSGVAVSDSAAIDKLKVDRSELAKRGANVFIRMMFRDGFYHADPHPGNFLLLRDGRIGLLDAGMVGRIDDNFRRQIEDILLAAGDRDADRLTDAVTRVCGSPRELDRVALSSALSDLFQEYGTQAVGQFDVGGALTAVTDILHEHKLVMPGRLSMLIKCLILLEGTGRLLSPSFSLAELLAPWRQKLLWRRFSPEARLRNMRLAMVDWDRLSQTVPRLASRLVEQVESGKFAFRLEHRHLKSAANRLVAGMFVSALLIGSTLLLGMSVRPTIWGISVPGVIGYLAAVVFGARMVWINRDKKVVNSDSDWD